MVVVDNTVQQMAQLPRVPYPLPAFDSVQAEFLENAVTNDQFPENRASRPSGSEWLNFALGQEDPLEKEVATHSSILIWEIPWTEEPGGLQSTR